MRFLALMAFVCFVRGSEMDSWFTRRPIERIRGQDDLALGGFVAWGPSVAGGLQAVDAGPEPAGLELALDHAGLRSAGLFGNDPISRQKLDLDMATR